MRTASGKAITVSFTTSTTRPRKSLFWRFAIARLLTNNRVRSFGVGYIQTVVLKTIQAGLGAIPECGSLRCQILDE